MWDLWWTKWHCDSIFSEYFGATLSLSFHPFTILIRFCVLLLPQKKNGRRLGTSQNAKPFRKSGSILPKSTGTFIFSEPPATRPEDCVRSQASQCEIYVEPWGKGGRLVSQHFGFPCRCHFTNASYSSSSTCWSHQKDKINDLSETRKHWIKKCIHLDFQWQT